MLRLAIILITILGLSACEEPFAGVDRLQDVEGAEDTSGLGFLAAFSQSVSGPDAQQVSMGATLDYGEIATNCEAKGRDLGSKIGDASGYEIYDSKPGTTNLRTHYVTGFRDGCARQFSAALVLLGDVGTHEFIRYADNGLEQEYSDTDEAYEVIKGSFCRVARGKPCGRRINRLSRNTTFVTVYERFGASPRWAEILIHKGEVVAMDFEGE